MEHDSDDIRGGTPKRSEIHFGVHDFNVRVAPKITEQSVKNCRQVVAKLRTKNPFAFNFHIQGMDAMTLQMVWQQVGRSAGHVSWYINDRLVALSLLLSGLDDYADASALSTLFTLKNFVVPADWDAALRGYSRPFLSTIYFDPDISGTSPATVVAIGLAQEFFTELKPRHDLPPLVDPSAAPKLPNELLELQLSESGELKHRAWRFPWFAKDLSKNLQPVADLITANLESSPTSFEQLIDFGGSKFRIEWASPDKTNAIAVIHHGEFDVAVATTLLLLSGKDTSTDERTLAAFEKSYFAGAPTPDFVPVRELIVTAPRPTLVTASMLNPFGADLVQGAIPWVIAGAFFKHISVIA